MLVRNCRRVLSESQKAGLSSFLLATCKNSRGLCGAPARVDVRQRLRDMKKKIKGGRDLKRAWKECLELYRGYPEDKDAHRSVLQLLCTIPEHPTFGKEEEEEDMDARAENKVNVENAGSIGGGGSSSSNNSTIYVTSLGKSMQYDRIRKMMEKFGPIERMASVDAHWGQEMKTDNLRGGCIIQFKNIADAEKAIEAAQIDDNESENNSLSIRRYVDYEAYREKTYLSCDGSLLYEYIAVSEDMYLYEHSMDNLYFWCDAQTRMLAKTRKRGLKKELDLRQTVATAKKLLEYLRCLKHGEKGEEKNHIILYARTHSWGCRDISSTISAHLLSHILLNYQSFQVNTSKQSLHSSSSSAVMKVRNREKLKLGLKKLRHGLKHGIRILKNIAEEGKEEDDEEEAAAAETHSSHQHDFDWVLKNQWACLIRVTGDICDVDMMIMVIHRRTPTNNIFFQMLVVLQLCGAKRKDVDPGWTPQAAAAVSKGVSLVTYKRALAAPLLAALEGLCDDMGGICSFGIEIEAEELEAILEDLVKTVVTIYSPNSDTAIRISVRAAIMLFKLGSEEKGNEFLDDAILLSQEGDEERYLKPEAAEEYAIGAQQLYELQKYADAEDMLRKCIKILNNNNNNNNNKSSKNGVGDADSLSLASKYHDLGMILLAAGEVEDAAIELKHALRIKNKLLEKTDPAKGNTHHGYGQVLMKMRRFDEAEKQFLVAHLLYREIWNGDGQPEPWERNYHQKLYHHHQEKETKRNTLLNGDNNMKEKCRETYKLRSGTVLGHLGELFFMRGDLTKAEQVLKSAISLKKSCKMIRDNDKQVLVELNNLASVLVANQKYQDAISTYQDLIILLSEKEGERSLSVAVTKVWQANSHVGLGELNKASELMEEALVPIQQNLPAAKQVFFWKRHSEILTALGREEEAKHAEEMANVVVAT
eukprot:jgi/Bigna1/89743/estExt_fgenesh1_pg.C_540134